MPAPNTSPEEPLPDPERARTTRRVAMPLALAMLGAVASQVRLPLLHVGAHHVAIPVAGAWLLASSPLPLATVARRHARLLALLGAIGLWGLVTSLAGEEPAPSLRAVGKLALLAPFCLGLLAHAATPPGARALCHALLGMLILLALGGVVEGFFPEGPPFSWLRTERSLSIAPRVASLLSWPNPYGVLMLAGIALAGAMRSLALVGSGGAAAASLLFLFQLAQSGSRNAWVTALVTLPALALAGSGGTSRTIGLIAAGGAMVVILPVPAYQLGLRDVRELPIARGMLDDGALASPSLADPLQSLSLRSKLWRAAAPMVRDHPFGGIGPGVFARRIAPGVLGKGELNAHCLPLDIAVATGLPGLALAVALLMALLRGSGPGRLPGGALLLPLLAGQILDSFLYEPAFVLVIAVGAALRGASPRP